MSRFMFPTARPFGLASVGLLSLALAGCPDDTTNDDAGLDAAGADVPGLDAPGADVPGLDAPAMTDTGPVSCAVTGYPTLNVETFATGLTNPVYITQAPGSDDFFVIEQGGIIRVVDASGAVQSTPFLDISDDVAFGGGSDERGLLGLAFHPGYATNGLFYIYYSDDTSSLGSSEDQVVAVGHRATARTAEPTVAVILRIPDQAYNHNAGCLQFGLDGELYIGSGDGGPQGDPENDAQNVEANLLGKILRIHVDETTGSSYTIPAGNPFAGATPGMDEIYLYGFRNPWRFSFDRVTGDLYIGDVGQGDWEEVDVVEAGTGAGDNFGWRSCEGFEGFGSFGATGSPCTFDHHRPAVVTSHGADPVVPNGSISVVSGYVYRGAAIPGLVGAYLFGDYGPGYVAAFRYCDGAVTEYQELAELTGSCNGLVSFGQDNAGELYMVCRGGRSIRRIIAD